MTETEQQVADRIRQIVRIRGIRFDFIDLDAATVLHLVHFGFSGWACVVGDPNNAAYEWVVRSDSQLEATAVYRHSNSGYGSAALALRDGLIAAEL